MHLAKYVMTAMLVLTGHAALAGDGAVVLPALSYTLDHSNIASGGVETGAVTRWLLEAGLTVDLERTAGISGAEFFASIRVQRGDDGSGLAGDIQAFSNIDSEDFEDFGEVGFAQTFMEGLLRYRLGLLDANTDFAVVDAAGEFINSSAGYTPTLQNLPSYPDTVPAANLSVQPADWWSVAAGVYESLLEDRAERNGSGLFFMMETRFFWNEGGRLVLGGWSDHGTTHGLDGSLRESLGGYYAVLEQRIRPGLDLFLQYGSVDEEVSEVDTHYAAGLAATGLFPSRADDTAGFMVSRAGISPASGGTEDETAFELFYGFRICDHTILKPDLQYIVHPSGDPAIDDALAATIRLEFGF